MVSAGAMPRRRDVAPRCRTPTPCPRRTRAPHPRRSRTCAARGVLRPRPVAAPGRAAPEAARASRRTGVRARTTRAVPAGRALLRSDGPSATPHPRASYYGRGITLSSPLVGPPPYLSARPSFSRRLTSLPPFHRVVVAAAWQAVASPRLWATARVSSFPRTRSTSPITHCHLCAPPPSSEPRATASAAVGPHRAPTPACSPPQHRSPPGLGEPTDVPRHFPGRERGWLAGICRRRRLPSPRAELQAPNSF
jgi:hypothetical protein